MGILQLLLGYEAIFEVVDEQIIGEIQPLPNVPPTPLGKARVRRVHAAPWGTAKPLCGFQGERLRRTRTRWRRGRWPIRCEDCNNLAPPSQ